jgi:microcystin-dependent protein
VPNYFTVQSLDLPGGVPDVPDIGDLKHRAAAVIPAGWLLCDGAAKSRATYAALFGVIGTTWGPGDGVSTFNLPDLRGRSLVGNGTGAGLTNRVIGTTGGEENHTLITNELSNHSHTVTDPGHSHTVPILNQSGVGTPGSTNFQGANISDTTITPTSDPATTGIVATDGEGGGGGHNTMHPWAAGYPLIYAGV